MAAAAARVAFVMQADLQAATAGQIAAGPHTADVINQILTLVTAVTAMEANGTAIGAGGGEVFDYVSKLKQIPVLMRQLGLYPNATVAAAAANPVG